MAGIMLSEPTIARSLMISLDTQISRAQFAILSGHQGARQRCWYGRGRDLLVEGVVRAKWKQLGAGRKGKGMDGDNTEQRRVCQYWAKRMAKSSEDGRRVDGATGGGRARCEALHGIRFLKPPRPNLQRPGPISPI